MAGCLLVMAAALSQQAFFGERNKYTGLAASPPLCLAIRPELHFSLGSSLDLVISAEARQVWTLTPARAVASHLGWGRRGCRHRLKTQRRGRVAAAARPNTNITCEQLEIICHILVQLELDLSFCLGNCCVFFFLMVFKFLHKFSWAVLPLAQSKLCISKKNDLVCVSRESPDKERT